MFNFTNKHRKESESHSVVSNSLRPHGLYSPWDSPGQNTGVGNLSRLQGIFPTQGSNPGLLHCRQILYQLSHQGSPRILALLQRIFSIQESNQGLLHSRQIFYQLSYQRSTSITDSKSLHICLCFQVWQINSIR